MSVVVDGLVTDFVAVVKRVHALDEDQQNVFFEEINIVVNNDAEFDSSMEQLAEYFNGEE